MIDRYCVESCIAGCVAIGITLPPPLDAVIIAGCSGACIFACDTDNITENDAYDDGEVIADTDGREDGDSGL
jgi:hypothetical protein